MDEGRVLADEERIPWVEFLGAAMADASLETCRYVRDHVEEFFGQYENRPELLRVVAAGWRLCAEVRLERAARIEALADAMREQMGARASLALLLDGPASL